MKPHLQLKRMKTIGAGKKWRVTFNTYSKELETIAMLMAGVNKGE